MRVLTYGDPPMKFPAALILILAWPATSFAQGEEGEEPLHMRPNPEEYNYKDYQPEGGQHLKTDGIVGPKTLGTNGKQTGQTTELLAHEVTHIYQHNQTDLDGAPRGQFIGLEQEGLTPQQIQAVKKAQMDAIGQSAK